MLDKHMLNMLSSENKDIIIIIIISVYIESKTRKSYIYQNWNESDLLRLFNIISQCW